MRLFDHTGWPFARKGNHTETLTQWDTNELNPHGSFVFCLSHSQSQLSTTDRTDPSVLPQSFWRSRIRKLNTSSCQSALALGVEFHMCTGKLWSMTFSWWIPITLKCFHWSFFDVGVLAVVFEPMGKNRQTLWCFAKRIPQKCRDNLTPSVEGFAMAISWILTFLRKFQDLQPGNKQVAGRSGAAFSSLTSTFAESFWLILGCPMFSKKKSCSTFTISFGPETEGNPRSLRIPNEDVICSSFPAFDLCAFLTGCYMSERVKKWWFQCSAKHWWGDTFAQMIQRLAAIPISELSSRAFKTLCIVASPHQVIKVSRGSPVDGSPKLRIFGFGSFISSMEW